jgi:hypothetical protein
MNTLNLSEKPLLDSNLMLHDVILAAKLLALQQLRTATSLAQHTAPTA